MIVSPTREWLQPICSDCESATGDLLESDISIEKFTEKCEIAFGEGNFKAAVKLSLYVNGMTVWGKHVVQALRALDRARQKKLISLKEIATHYGMNVTNTRLKKDVDSLIN